MLQSRLAAVQQLTLWLFILCIPGSWVVAALSDSDVQKIMGDGLTGSSKDVDPFTVTVVLNQTAALIAMESTKTVGWMAVGVGSAMVNSDMYIGWPNGDSWVLSHRSCSDYEQPKEVSGGSGDLVLVPDLSTDKMVVFTRALDFSDGKIDVKSSFKMVYAASKTKPTSTDTDVSIEEHDVGSYGTVSIDTSAKFGTDGGGSTSEEAIGGDAADSSTSRGSSSDADVNPTGSSAGKATDATKSGSAATPSGSSSSSGSGSDATSNSSDAETITEKGPSADPKTIFLVHAILAIIAWGVFTPLAIVFGRFRPFASSASLFKKPILYWLHMHERLQYTTMALTIVVVAMGVYGINLKKMDHFTTTHQLYGVIFLGLVICQGFLGWLVHALGGGGDDKRPLKRCLHIILGLTLTSTGLWQCWTGWKLLPRAMIEWPDAVRTAVGVIAGLMCAAYVGKVIQTMFKRSSLISGYNMRARQIRMPDSRQSVFSRTRTARLAKDIEELEQKVASFSQRPSMPRNPGSLSGDKSGYQDGSQAQSYDPSYGKVASSPYRSPARPMQAMMQGPYYPGMPSYY